ncbi:unnamed protein product [Didymodactylos carnosus]|uniref:Reverse transcriptase domain-containing protein n=1 Tax=Didymodactylos carnosus TaxID=1234261 RepID=A0A815PBK3_9BILA|nr:unnamed protein product [Didymodactylos carnosus]CAF4321587.1 unnamed protein product [Didymodactylos carnosus]
MNNLIGNGRWDYVLVYLDDIVIFSKSRDDHLKHISEILSILHEANFQLNPDKCTIMTTKLEFLGHTITEQQITPSQDRIQAILNIEEPRTLKQANRFIGKMNWYRKFIPHFADMAAPIHRVTNKTKNKRREFYWGPEQTTAFHHLKRILVTQP